MTSDEIIRMAREAGLLPDNSHPAPQTRHMADKEQRLERFAALAYEAGRRDENEACARVCEHNAAFGNVDERYASRECAAAIRSRREQ